MRARSVFAHKDRCSHLDAAKADGGLSRLTGLRVGRARTPGSAQAHWGRAAGAGRSRMMDRPGATRVGSVGSPRCSRIGLSEAGSVTAALAHLTAMDGGNAKGLQEQSLPCASRHLHSRVQ